MMRILLRMVVTILPASIAWGQTPPIQMVADTNRDGVVDFEADLHDRHFWSTDRGAVFLNNCDSDQNKGEPDHADSIVNGAADLDDLAMIRIRILANFITTGSTLTVQPDAASASRIRLFYKDTDESYKVVPANGSLHPSLLAGPLELRIEANQFASPAWNGEVELTAIHTDPGQLPSSDVVRLKVAPFMMLSNLDPATELYIRDYPSSISATTNNVVMIGQLQTHTAAAGMTMRVVPAGNGIPSNQIWLQDTMEIGYTEMPGQRINVVLRANRNRALDNWAKGNLLAPDYGWFTVGTYRSAYASGSGSTGNEWLDWFGNLEVTPPLGNHAFGRIYYGVNGNAGLDPVIVNMLAAQGFQGPPVALDTGWLLIKHVDEMLCFIPSGNPERPYKVLVPDTNVMRGLLDQWIGEGRGSATILPIFKSGMTISSMRNATSTVNYNSSLQENRINPMINVAKAQFGITEDDIIRVPAWYETNGASMVPNMVNSVVANGYFLSPDPDGPVVGGKDLLAEHFKAQLAPYPLQVEFIDDRRYHLWSGNVHCGTNVRRNPSTEPLWRPVPAAPNASSILLY